MSEIFKDRHDGCVAQFVAAMPFCLAYGKIALVTTRGLFLVATSSSANGSATALTEKAWSQRCTCRSEVKLVNVVDDIRPANSTQAIQFLFEWLAPADFEPRLMELDRCAEWRWFPLDAMPPQDKFLSAHRKLITRYIAGVLYE